MNKLRKIDRAALSQWFTLLVEGGRRVVAPVQHGDQIRFEPITPPYRPLDGCLRTIMSAKALVFPPHEPLVRFRLNGHDVSVNDRVPPAPPTVLFGVHPCDAAAFQTLDAVFVDDKPDAHVQARREQLTVIGVSCTEADDYCFCTSVGGGPGDTRGSDLLLTPLDAECYLVEVLTERGAAVVQTGAELFTETSDTETAKEPLLAHVPKRFSTEGLGGRLRGMFSQGERWADQSLRCLGCGACAFVCPTCSCFDIQDERVRDEGVRLRCWDSCGFSLFTLHASGHNPRTRGSDRWRQRVLHKFAYQPARLGRLGCVGCGRCSRACPVDMNLAEHLTALAETPS